MKHSISKSNLKLIPMVANSHEGVYVTDKIYTKIQELHKEFTNKAKQLLKDGVETKQVFYADWDIAYPNDCQTVVTYAVTGSDEQLIYRIENHMFPLDKRQFGSTDHLIKDGVLFMSVLNNSSEKQAKINSYYWSKGLEMYDKNHNLIVNIGEY